MTPYVFVVLRYMLSPSDGQLVNIGVVMWTPERRTLDFRVREQFSRLSTFFPGFDGHAYRFMVRHLLARFTRAAEELSGTEAMDLFTPALPREPELIFERLLQPDSSCF